MIRYQTRRTAGQLRLLRRRAAGRHTRTAETYLDPLVLRQTAEGHRERWEKVADRWAADNPGATPPAPGSLAAITAAACYAIEDAALQVAPIIPKEQRAALAAVDAHDQARHTDRHAAHPDRKSVV